MKDNKLADMSFQFAKEIIELVNNNEIISKTVDLIRQYSNKAIASLEFIKDNQYKQELISLCENLYKVV